MTPFTIDLNEVHQHHHQLFFCSKSDASSSSSISYPIFINPPHQQLGYYHTESQKEGTIYWDHSTLNNEKENDKKISVCKKEEKSTSIEDERENTSVKWMSSKMRLMRKMMNSDQTVNSSCMLKEKRGSSYLQDDNSSKNLCDNSNNTIRVCADCNTTKTPLWRSGPRGPKSLCNACGIRQRKARRAMAAAQASANGASFGPDTETASPMNTKTTTINKVQNKEKKRNNSHLPFKKRCKFTTQSRGSRKKLCFEDLSSIILSKNSAFQQLFPQDEKEAAILLMSLSYGLVHA